MKKVLLISGGFDSLLISEMKHTAIDYYIYLDYDHKFKERELEVLENWKALTEKNIEIIKMRALPDKDGFFFGRNLNFFITLRERFINENILVYFGNNADDNYNDNTREFLARVEKVINDSYPTKTMRIICPLENDNKQEIINKYGMTNLYRHGIEPYYCDSGEKIPCKKCHSCLAMIEAGLL